MFLLEYYSEFDVVALQMCQSNEDPYFMFSKSLDSDKQELKDFVLAIEEGEKNISEIIKYCSTVPFILAFIVIGAALKADKNAIINMEAYARNRLDNEDCDVFIARSNQLRATKLLLQTATK